MLGYWICLALVGTGKHSLKWLHDFTTPPKMNEGSSISPSSLIFIIVSLIVLAILDSVSSIQLCLMCISFFSLRNGIYLFFSIILLFNYSCLHCRPTPPTPHPNPPPSLASTLPLGFFQMSFLLVPENPSSTHCLLLPPLWLLIDCS